MKYIKTDWQVPYYNLALEEYLLTKTPQDDFFFFYINDPSIIVGRFQNTLEEINNEYVKQNDICVARRLTGGGAVYHDDGNLNFSFILRADAKDVNNFEKYVTPIINALESMGVHAELAGRNDILIDGKKVSGNAQYSKNNMLIHHGTLLFDSKMENLSRALNVKDIKIKSKGTKSVRSRVANIKDYMDSDIGIMEFKENILNYMKETEKLTEYVLSDEDLDWVDNAVKTKFSTWDWNWGKSPDFDIQRIEKFSCGIIDARIKVGKGTITDCKIYGDFFVKKDIDILEQFLMRMTYNNRSIRVAFEVAVNDITIDDFFHTMTLDEFVEFICPQ